MHQIPSVPSPGDRAEAWSELLQALRPAAMIVAIHQRMSPALRARLSAEDVWQETLLHAWRDRAKFVWQGLPAFRRYLLQIAENRLRNAVDYFDARRRAGALEGPPNHASAAGESLPEPIASTTPSRVAGMHEEIAAMRDALEALPDELRDVVRLRLFEELPLADISARLGIGLSAAKHRLRRGAIAYQQRLRLLLERSRHRDPQ